MKLNATIFRQFHDMVCTQGVASDFRSTRLCLIPIFSFYTLAHKVEMLNQPSTSGPILLCAHLLE